MKDCWKGETSLGRWSKTEKDKPQLGPQKVHAVALLFFFGMLL